MHKHGCSFTDDSILTIALAEAILTGESYTDLLKLYYYRYPDAGYGGMYRRWAASPETSEPYNSFGNCAAMRISAVGFAFDSLGDVMDQAKKYTEITHNHPEGIKGAQSVASIIYLARNGAGKPILKEFVERSFGYDLSPTLDEIDLIISSMKHVRVLYLKPSLHCWNQLTLKMLFVMLFH